jgi:signal transduction histidine kinase
MDTQKLRDQLHNLNEVSRNLLRCQTVEEIIEKALAEVRRRLNTQVASIFLLSKDGVIKRVGIDGVDKDNHPIDKNWFRDEQYQPEESFSGKAIPAFEAEYGYGEPQYSNDLLADYPSMINENPYLQKLGQLKCGISVPLNGPNTTFGTIEVLNKSAEANQDKFSLEDVYWLTQIGTIVANFIVENRRKERFRIYKKLLEYLVTLENDYRNFKLSEVCQFVVEKVTTDFTPYKVCIIRIPDEGDGLNIMGKSCDGDEDFLEGRKDGSIKSGSQIVGEVYKSKQPKILPDIGEEIHKFNNKEWIENKKLKSFACLPLLIQNECVGTISVYTQYHYKFYNNYWVFLDTIALYIAAIITRVKMSEEFRQIRQERNDIRESFLNASVLVSYDQMSKNILHQYKNKLISFSQFLETISAEDRLSNKERARIVAEQKESIDQQIEEIKQELEITNNQSIDINQTLKEVVRGFSFAFSDTDIQVIETYDKTIPLMNLDEREIKDIIFNLLSNAEKAIQKAERKKGEITIMTSIDTLEGIQYIKIMVADNGIGIAKDIQDKIFTRGFTTRAKEGGTGLGLYVVHEIIKSYGGKIYFDSSVKGTKFYVGIPLKRYKI